MGASRKPVRSVSLPNCRSHPNTDQTEKLLNKVKTWESTLPSSNPSADMICSGFSHLTRLYECLEDLFNTNNPMQWTDELLDISVNFLEICGNTTDVISQTIQHVRELGCDLRRNGGCTTESIIAKYIGFRKKVKKDIKGSMASLKQADNLIRGYPFMADSENYHMMCVFREVTSFSIVVFRLLLEFLAIPSLRKPRTGRWTVVSRFLSSRKVVPEGKLTETSVNELQRLDAALLRCSSIKKVEFIQVVPEDLEELEATLDGISSHLHSISRQLIATRVSILNMVSFY